VELLESKTFYDGHTVAMTEKRYRRADGTEVDRQVVEHPGSVAILAFDETFAYLVRQPREAVEDDGLLEIPAGTLDVEDESELACAQRELAEEAGLAAADWERLQVALTSPGWADERVTIFLASGLSRAEGEQDPGERIEVVRLPLADIADLLPGIHDAKTLIALLMLEARRR
jgi:ADP-ribose pyrophosphatase